MRFSTCTHCHRQITQDAETGPGWLTVWRGPTGDTGCDGHANVFALHYPTEVRTLAEVAAS